MINIKKYTIENYNYELSKKYCEKYNYETGNCYSNAFDLMCKLKTKEYYIGYVVHKNKKAIRHGFLIIDNEIIDSTPQEQYLLHTIDYFIPCFKVESKDMGDIFGKYPYTSIVGFKKDEEIEIIKYLQENDIFIKDTEVLDILLGNSGA